MERILVTGATGFVGRRLCKALADHGHSVLAVVRQAKPEHEQLARDIIPMGELGPTTKWDPAVLKDVTAVIHLAARVHVLKETSNDPAAEFERVNVGATTALAKAAAAGRVRRFVYVSSLHAMRTLADEQLCESSQCQPDGPYGQSKLDAEAAVRKIGEDTGLETTILRPPPVYGPGHVGRLMSLFKFVRRGLPLPVRGLNNRRSLVFVDNLVDSLIECAINPNARAQTFLVSDGDDVSLPELVSRMGQAFGRKAWLLPAPIGIMRATARIAGKTQALDRLLGSLAVDSQFIRKQLDWSPPYTLDQGLQVTANWMKGAA